MKIQENGHILFFVRLLAAGLLTGIFWGKDEKYKKLETNYNILHQKNIYLKKSRQELLRQQQRFRSIRHEMKNDYILEMEYLKNELYPQLREHYLEKIGYDGSETRIVHTGNISMDAILNHKLTTADRDKIHIDVQHQLLGCIKIDNRDLNMLLGNLLDNAMEAARQLRLEERKIALQIKTDATALFLEISNKYLGKTQKDKSGNYLTQKADKPLHGLGLLKVRHIAHKYGGDVVISDENNYFNVKVLLYMRES